MIIDEIRSLARSLECRGVKPYAVTVPEDRLWEFAEAVAGISVMDGQGKWSNLKELDVLLAIDSKRAPQYMGLYIRQGDRLSVFASGVPA